MTDSPGRLRGPDGKPTPTGDDGKPFRRMQEFRRIGAEFPFICPVDFTPHRGSPLGSDPNLDPDFVASHRLDDGAHYPA